jgi:hypothetical protein
MMVDLASKRLVFFDSLMGQNRTAVAMVKQWVADEAKVRGGDLCGRGVGGPRWCVWAGVGCGGGGRECVGMSGCQNCLSKPCVGDEAKVRKRWGSTHLGYGRE